jgi:O-antigen/teichoic acid export membrane protein
MRLRGFYSHYGTLLAIAAGAVSAILINLIFAKVLSVEEFGEFSLILTVISFITSFGLFGMDQSLIRAIAGRGGGRKISFGLARAFVLWIFGISFAAASAAVVVYGFSGRYAFFAIYAISFSITLSIFLSSLLRAHMLFLRSQLIAQGWKLLLFAVSIFFYFGLFPARLPSIIWVLSACCALPVFFFAKSGVAIDISDRGARDMGKIFREGLCFIVMLATVAFLNTADRFVIPKLLGYEALANYFIFWTVICGPFIMLQTAIGFILLPKIREYHVSGRLPEKIRRSGRAIFAAASLAVLSGVFVYFFSSWIIGLFYPGKYSIADPVKALLVILGLLRLSYSVVSSLVGAVASLKGLIFSNLLALLSVAVFFYCALYLFRGHGLWGIAVSLCCAWAFRIAAWAGVAAVSLRRPYAEGRA